MSGTDGSRGRTTDGRSGGGDVGLNFSVFRHDLARRRGKSAAEAKDMVRRFSGHSLRAGYATSAAAADVPALRIQQHTRHKSADMVARYVRESDKWSKSGLKGVLHRARAEEATP